MEAAMRHLSLFCCVVTALSIAALHTSRAVADEETNLSFKRLPKIERPVGEAAPIEQPSTIATTQPVRQAASRLGSRAPLVAPYAEPPLPNQTRHALAFYGGYSARTTLSQMPRRMPIQPAPARPLYRPAKPFANLSQDPTISPYLNLDHDESETDLPNYFTYVRPQMEQLQLNQLQQRELQQLRSQLQSVTSSAAGATYHPGGVPGSRTSARFMDTAQFYGSWR
jgi:hypothetical protein